MNKILLLSCLLFFSIFTINAQKDSIKIDFGEKDMNGKDWNIISKVRELNDQILYNQKNFVTPYTLSILEGFSGVNKDGERNTDPSLDIPEFVSKDNFYGSLDTFGNKVTPRAVIELSYLDVNKTYEIQVFASRTASDNRQTKYTITGESKDSFYFQVASNTDDIITYSTKPDNDGKIHIVATAGPQNDNPYGFYYMGMMRIIYDELPTPPVEDIVLLSPKGGETWLSSTIPEIKWRTGGRSTVDIFYSLNNGNEWEFIDEISAGLGRYEWTVPSITSHQALIRISDGNDSVESDSVFSIVDTMLNCRIVVLGSSTAAGSGPSSRDSAWVYKYQSEIFQENTAIEVINLARGGYTTDHILPTGQGSDLHNIDVDIERNVSKALDLNADAVIINMPSNDTSKGFKYKEQVNNYRTLYNFLVDAGVTVYICTTQPVSYSSQSKRLLQDSMKNTILEEYGAYAIDFWSEIVDEHLGVKDRYNSGDNTHLNDAAHRYFFDQVWKKELQKMLCQIENIVKVSNTEKVHFSIFPNPSRGIFNLTFSNMVSPDAVLSIIDVVSGRVVQEFPHSQLTSHMQIDLSNRDSGLYLLRVRDHNEISTEKVFVITQ